MQLKMKTINKFMIALFILIIGILMAFPMINAEQSNLGTMKQNTCFDLYQTCDDCSYVNLTSVKYPNGTMSTFNLGMTKTNQNFNYTFCNTSAIGDYTYTIAGDKGGVYSTEVIEFSITGTGEVFGNTQGLMILGQLGIVALFLAIGFGFSREKWKSL